MKEPPTRLIGNHSGNLSRRKNYFYTPENSKVYVHKEIYATSRKLNTRFDVLTDEIDRGFQALLDRLEKVFITALQPMIKALRFETEPEHRDEGWHDEEGFSNHNPLKP